MLKHVQEFIEKYYPNYHSSDEIAHWLDLENARDGNFDQSNPHDSAWKLIRDEYDSDPENMTLELDYAEKYVEILETAISGFGDEHEQKEAVYNLFKNTDWELLKKQKRDINLYLAGTLGAYDIRDSLEGLVNFLDSVQDLAVDHFDVPEEEVFDSE